MQKESAKKQSLSEQHIQKIVKEWNLGKEEQATRLKAFHAFQSLHMPELKYGFGVHTPLHEFNIESVSPEGKVDCSFDYDAEEVTKKGAYCSGMPTEGRYADLVKKYRFTTLDPYASKLTALAAAFRNIGIFCYIPPAVELNTPLAISSKLQSGSLFDHILIVADKDAKATIIDTQEQDGLKGFRSGIVEIIALEGAKVNYVGIQKLNTNTYNFVEKRANVHKDAEVIWLDCNFGSQTTVAHTASALTDQGAQTNNMGLFFGSANQHFDLTTISDHTAPHTTSDMLSRGVLTGESRLVFNGLVKIGKHAPNSNGFQTQNTLLLSDKARADATPKLEIDNNDVKCSHATTMGRVDEDQLFYLMSRGLTKEEAQQKIVEGFFVPLFQRINIPQGQQRIEKELAKVSHVLST